MWTELGSQPVIKRPFSEGKKSMLANDLALMAVQAGVRDQAGWERVVSQYHALTSAMIQAIDPSPANPVTLALANQLEAAGEGYLPGLPANLWQETARQSVQSVLLNRRDDLHASLALLADPTFTQSVFGAAAAGQLRPTAELGPLPAPKRQELMESLLQPHSGKMEPALHIHASAMGHQRMHQGLAQSFQPTGSAATLIAARLSTLAPAVPQELVQAYTSRWMSIRQIRAQQVADAMRPDSTLVQNAVRLSEESRMREGERVASPVAIPMEKPASRIMTAMHDLMEVLAPFLGKGTPAENTRSA